MNARPELWYLKNVDLLSELPDTTLNTLRSSALLVEIKRRQAYPVDSAAGQLCVITEGLAKLCRVSSSGNKVVETVLREGDIFGRIVLDGPRSVLTVEAMSDMKLLLLTKLAVAEAIRNSPGLAIEVIQMLEDRQRRLSRQVESLLYKDVAARVIETLLHIARSEPDRCSHGWALDVRITQMDLAELVGASRQAVNRVLRSLEDRNFVHRSGRLLCIRDLHALSELVENA